MSVITFGFKSVLIAEATTQTPLLKAKKLLIFSHLEKKNKSEGFMIDAVVLNAEKRFLNGKSNQNIIADLSLIINTLIIYPCLLLSQTLY